MSAWTFRSSDGKAAVKIVPPRLRIPCWKGLGADSEEKHEPVSDIDTAVVDSLKVLDPKRPIREADMPGQNRINCTPINNTNAPELTSGNEPFFHNPPGCAVRRRLHLAHDPTGVPGWRNLSVAARHLAL